MSDKSLLVAVGVLVSLLAWSPVLWVAAGWIEAPPLLYVVLLVLRAAVMIGLGALVRPWPLKIVVLLPVALFLVLDVAATMGVFSVYAPPWGSAEEEFIYFQF